MAFDGIVTKAITYELKNIIGFKIDKIYQPDKNTVIIGIYGNGCNKNLILCISSNCYRINLTNHLPKNPLVAPNFCMTLRKHLIGMKIKNIYTRDLERIVFIDLENNENPNFLIKKQIIVELMGKHSNIILTDANNIIIDSLRHTSIENNSARDIYPTSKYIFLDNNKYSFLEEKNFDDFYFKIEACITEILLNVSSNVENLSITNFNLDKIISNTYNGISSSFVKNIINNLGIEYLSKEALKTLYNKIKEILEFKNLDIIFTKKDFFIYTSKIENTEPYKINFAIDNFYLEKETLELFNNYRNSILNLILATLKKYEKRLINIDSKINECNNKDIFKLYGELITSNLYRIPSHNMDYIELENYYDNNKILKIPLNNKYSPSYNAKLYFKKYTKLKNSLEIINTQKEETIKDINYIESIVYELNECKTIEDVEYIYEEISETTIFSNKLKTYKNNKNTKIRKSKQLTNNKNAKFNPLKYIIDGYTILVGRNNLENDYLTCKYAKKTDLWFHTKYSHGSHVILKNTTNEIIPEKIIYETAKLAVLHSKAKNSSHTPVDYCKVSFVKKPNGSKPGFVIYSNNKTIYI